jgi:hypothetical protein
MDGSDAPLLQLVADAAGLSVANLTGTAAGGPARSTATGSSVTAAAGTSCANTAGRSAHPTTWTGQPRKHGSATWPVRTAFERREQSPEDANAVINIVAAVLGEHICAPSDLRWAIITDELGSDLCVHDPATNWVFFPQSSVAKRWEAKELGWVLPFVAWVKQTVSAPPR